MFQSAPPEWERTTLGDVTERGGGHIQTGPFGSQLHASDYVPDGVPSIMPVNIGDNRLIRDGIACISEEDAQRLSRHIVHEGDIIYSRRGDVERRALVRAEQDGWFCGTGCLKVRVGDGVADPEFTSYYLGHPEVRSWLARHAVRATLPHLNTGIMSAIPFLRPPLDEQRAIAGVLAALDDKIELNQRMNRALEKTARAIFKAWFVDFEPVKAKAGDALPDQFTETELGPVPAGWSFVPIGQLVEVVGGATPSTKEPTYWESGEHPFCTPKDMSSLTAPVLLDTERHITQAGVDKISSGQLPVGTVILSSRAPIGYLALAATPLSVNQGIIAMLTGEIPNTYVLLWTEVSMGLIKSRAGGSTFAEISKRNFRPIPALRPDDQTLAAFAEIAQPVFELITANERESRVLARIRDALLPKLISGEIRVLGGEGMSHGG